MWLVCFTSGFNQIQFRVREDACTDDAIVGHMALVALTALSFFFNAEFNFVLKNIPLFVQLKPIPVQMHSILCVWFFQG